MRKYSYPYLFFVTVLSLGAIFLFYWWKVTIYRATFLYPLTSKYLMLISLAVSFLITLFLVSNGIMKKSPFQTYLKLFGSISIAMVLFSVITIMAITWFIPGVPSSYTAPYTYSTGSSKSCSGLMLTIRISGLASEFAIPKVTTNITTQSMLRNEVTF